MEYGSTPTLVWFRQDLRLQDNSALQAALEQNGSVIPVYIWSPEEEGDWVPGSAQRWWLHRALEHLRKKLEELNQQLVLRQGNALDQLLDIARETGAERVVWNRRYEPAITARDTRVKAELQDAGLAAESYNGSLLFEPWKVATGSGNPYKVYTPFWRNVKERQVAKPIETDLGALKDQAYPEAVRTEKLDSLELLPKLRWHAELEDCWTPSEHSAQQRLKAFAKEGAESYEERRNFPGDTGTSTLSPYLHFGHLSPRQVWWEVLETTAEGDGRTTFLKEIVWREFAYHVLFHYPDTPESPLRSEFKNFPWEGDAEALERWQKGQTGYPLVDAGMRQLWREGWMHNRVRMVVASLLVKHLLQPWQKGACWFWDTLVDADLASNTLGWQWAGGCGADAAPYFRVFNPITQSEKFDPEGTYIRRYVPELARLEVPHLHTPWEAPPHVLEAAGIRLDEDYPRPIIEHKAGRQRALEAFEHLKKDR